MVLVLVLDASRAREENRLGFFGDLGMDRSISELDLGADPRTTLAIEGQT